LGSALEVLTSALERSEQADMTDDDLDLITAGLAARFDLTEGQTRVLGRAAKALAQERDQTRRLAALAAVGTEARVGKTEDELLGRVVGIIGDAFGRDRMRIGLLRDGTTEYPSALATGPWDGAGDQASHPLVVAGKQAGTVEFFGRTVASRRAISRSSRPSLPNCRSPSRTPGSTPSWTLCSISTCPRRGIDASRRPHPGNPGRSRRRSDGPLRRPPRLHDFSERSSPEALVEMLNRYFGAAVPHVLDHGGTVIQFVGDAMLAVFNAPSRQPDHARQAALTAGWRCSGPSKG
jgi:hypothetical protein